MANSVTSADLLVRAAVLCIPNDNSLLPLFFAHRMLSYNSNITNKTDSNNDYNNYDYYYDDDYHQRRSQEFATGGGQKRGPGTEVPQRGPGAEPR